MFAARRASSVISSSSGARWASTSAGNDKYKVLVVGGGAGGMTIANQIYNRFDSAGKSLKPGDVAVLDASEYHYYQPGWTLVGAGITPKTAFRRNLKSLIPPHIGHIPEHVKSFSPDSNSITTASGRTLSYESLVVATGLQINWNAIPGLSKALADPNSGVKTNYSYETCDKVWKDIDALQSGKAIFTQPAGVIKCPGAPQKIMWMAWDRYQKTGRGNNIKVDFYTGMPTMFSVKKYSDALNDLRMERGIGGHFEHNLVSIDAGNRKATFKQKDGSTVDVDYNFLHATPPMGPLEVIKGSPIADTAGWVDVKQDSLQHVKYGNVFALGDCSNLLTARTAAAITAQAPVLTENLFSVMETGQLSKAAYNGYSSCPLLTGYGELMLAEFKYGFVPDESFAYLGDQRKRRRLFYHFKKDLFPWAYWNRMVTKGTWFGRSGFARPTFQ